MASWVIMYQCNPANFGRIHLVIVGVPEDKAVDDDLLESAGFTPRTGYGNVYEWLGYSFDRFDDNYLYSSRGKRPLSGLLKRELREWMEAGEYIQWDELERRAHQPIITSEGCQRKDAVRPASTDPTPKPDGEVQARYDREIQVDKPRRGAPRLEERDSWPKNLEILASWEAEVAKGKSKEVCANLQEYSVDTLERWRKRRDSLPQ